MFFAGRDIKQALPSTALIAGQMRALGQGHVSASLALMSQKCSIKTVAWTLASLILKRG
jgi:hypothetical protein